LLIDNNLVGYTKNPKLMQTQNCKLDFTGKDIFAGIDAHLKSWRVSIMVEGIACQTFTQNPIAKDLNSFLNKNYPGGQYHSAYEAGFCGFGPHRDLLKYNIQNIVSVHK
jgi:transposase